MHYTINLTDDLVGQCYSNQYCNDSLRLTLLSFKNIVDNRTIAWESLKVQGMVQNIRI